MSGTSALNAQESLGRLGKVREVDDQVIWVNMLLLLLDVVLTGFITGYKMLFNCYYCYYNL